MVSNSVKILLAVLAVLAAILVAFFSASCPDHRFTVGASGAQDLDITIPLNQLEDDFAYYLPIKIGDRSFQAIVDTGSPYITLPQSLPCTGAACTPTGQTRVVKYADGRRITVSFTRGHLTLGDRPANAIPLTFGGLPDTGPAGDSIFGLASLKGPAGPTMVGASPVDELGVSVIELDLTGRGPPTLRLANTGPGPATLGLSAVVDTQLLPVGALWEGVDRSMFPYYVVGVKPTLDQPRLRYMVIDTGTTQSVPTAPLPADKPEVVLTFDSGQQLVGTHGSGKEWGNPQPVYADKSLNESVGVLGNRSMRGYLVQLDIKGMRFRMYR
jgi:hypothetical protein